jgi:methyltransferase-like protein/ubiquinone/menaquinone biosynthesis C-methylase UbiE
MNQGDTMLAGSPHPKSTVVNPYDVTPYIDFSYVATHPDRLATMARLLGKEAAPVGTCRVLEIGCAAGGNLLPMAYSLPNAEFVGIDYSARQIEEGRRRIDRLGFQNIRLICADLGELDEGLVADLGTFDYFVAHGFYSWTPPAVRDAMLALCQRVLRPHGVAYVSYNTYPGWHTMKMLRDAMLYQGQDADTPAEKAEQGRKMLSFLAQHATEGLHKEVYRHYDEMLKKDLKGTDDSFLLHDELSDVNDPVYFYEFVEHAAQRGLQYLIEAELRTVLISSLPTETQAALKTVIWDAVDLEQKMDFVRNRMFRMSLLCHKETNASHALLPEAVTKSWLRSQARRLADHPKMPLPQGSVQFLTKDETTLTANHPLSIAALDILSQAWPNSIHFSELVRSAKLQIGTKVLGDEVQEEMMVAATLLKAHGQSPQVVELHSFEPVVAKHVSERPVASKIARFEAETRSTVTNVWHDRVSLLPIQKSLLHYLDGSRTVKEVAKMMRSALTDTQLNEHLRFFYIASLLVE